MIRRHFISTAFGAAAFPLAPRSGAAPHSVIDLDPTRPGAKISPLLHAHRGAAKVAAEIDSEFRQVAGQVPLPELSGSASIHGKSLTLTLVHTRHDTQTERTIRLRGASAKAMKATVFTPAGLRAHNRFDAPHTLEPHRQALTVSAPASVTKFEIELV